MAVAPSHAEPIAETTLLLNYLDSRVRKDTLPPGFSFEWTTLAYQQQRAGKADT